MGEHPTSSAVPTSIAFGLCDGTPTLGLRLRSPLPSIMYKELTKVNNREKNFPWLVWLLDIVPPVHTPYRPSATASRVAVHSLHYPLPQRTAISVSSTPLEIPAPWLSSPPPSNCSLHVAAGCSGMCMLGRTQTRVSCRPNWQLRLRYLPYLAKAYPTSFGNSETISNGGGV